MCVRSSDLELRIAEARMESARDLLVVEPFGDQTQDRHFAGGEPVGQGRLDRGCTGRHAAKLLDEAALDRRIE
jgi:hypothetical protein